MNVKTIVGVRKQAEEAVADMSEGPLKTKAFEVILDRLLVDRENESKPTTPSSPPASKNDPEVTRPNSTSSTDRILLLKDEGFFQEQRTIGEVREKLASRGWHYPVTSLSGPLQTLVQRALLRRVKVKESGKSGWKYSLP
jgi:hypothetical protein